MGGVVFLEFVRDKIENLNLELTITLKQFSLKLRIRQNQISSGCRGCGLIICSTIHCTLTAVTQDLSGCACDLVVDKDDGKIFIATTEYNDVKNKVKNDIQLILIMPRNTKSNP